MTTEIVNTSLHLHGFNVPFHTEFKASFENGEPFGNLRNLAIIRTREQHPDEWEQRKMIEVWVWKDYKRHILMTIC